MNFPEIVDIALPAEGVFHNLVIGARRSRRFTVASPGSVSTIENEFVRLSPEAQLTLLERLVHRARVAVSGNRDAWEAGISAMAADPEMQRELNRINGEFAATEADSLERR